MRKFTLTLLTAAVAFQLSAQATDMQSVSPVYPNGQINIVSATGHTYSPALSQSQIQDIKTSGLSRSISAEAPVGEKSYYAIHMDKLIQETNGAFALAKETTGATVLVKGEDNKVSLHCPFNIYPQHEGNYVDGEIDGDIMKFQLPAVIDEYGPTDFQLSLVRYDAEQNTYIQVEESENILQIKINEDGSLTILTSDIQYDDINVHDPSTLPETLLGLTYHDTPTNEFLWFVFGTWHTELIPVELNTVPERTVFEEWTLCQADPELKYSLDGWNRIAGVAIDGDDIYIRGISEYSEDSIIKGKYENGIATFSGIQAAGFCPNIDNICYFVATDAFREGNDIKVYYDPSTLKLTLDPERKILKSENVMMWCVIDPVTRTYLNQWYEPMCIENTPENLNANIEEPYVFGVNNLTDSGLGYQVHCFIPNINDNGCVLDKSKMYFNIYINGDLFKATTDKYPTIPEDMTDIPGDYKDNVFVINQMLYGLDAYALWLMSENYEVNTFGIQSFYEGSDGVIYSSPLYEYEYSGVNNPGSESASAVSEEYYTLEGVKVSKPTTGVYVKVSQLSDGRRKVEKIMQ